MRRSAAKAAGCRGWRAASTPSVEPERAPRGLGGDHLRERHLRFRHAGEGAVAAVREGSPPEKRRSGRAHRHPEAEDPDFGSAPARVVQAPTQLAAKNFCAVARNARAQGDQRHRSACSAPASARCARDLRPTTPTCSTAAPPMPNARWMTCGKSSAMPLSSGALPIKGRRRKRMRRKSRTAPYLYPRHQKKLRRSAATKQSTLASCGPMDCFAALYCKMNEWSIDDRDRLNLDQPFRGPRAPLHRRSVLAGGSMPSKNVRTRLADDGTELRLKATTKVVILTILE